MAGRLSKVCSDTGKVCAGGAALQMLHQREDEVVGRTAAEAWSDPERSKLASRCKSRSSEAALRITREVIQLHGAIGYTDEADLHLFMKRVWTLASTGGTPTEHARRVAAQLLA